jgi:AraC-like DNA-binding protein
MVVRVSGPDRQGTSALQWMERGDHSVSAPVTVSAAWVRGMAERFRSAGLDDRALFRQVGIDMAELDVPDARFASEQLSELWELAARQSGNPLLGLDLGGQARAASFDIVAYVMMSCPNLQSGLERFIRYLRIISEATTIELQAVERGHQLTFTFHGGTREIPRQRIDFILLMFLTFCRWVTARELQLMQVDYALPPPPDVKPYEKAFGCPLRFEAPVHSLYFSPQDMTYPLSSYNQTMADLHERFAGETLQRLENNKVGHKARDIIVRLLPDGEPMRADVARELCLSERTLQRRLEDEGTSFQKLVDSIRQELAERYLTHDRLTLGEAAYLVGFSEQSTFCRAFKRWTGMSPTEYRNKSLGGK